MAELLRRRRPQEHSGTHRHQLWHDAHRGTLRQMRCAFGPRFSGWSRADRAALLHELGIPRLQAEEVSELSKGSNRKENDGAPGVLARLNRRDARLSIVVLEFQPRIQTL